MGITSIGVCTSKTSTVRLLQILRDRGDAVALVDGEARDRQVRRIGADQRDVGAVQGGDVRQTAAFARMIAGQHLPRQHGADRVRNRVVHVQQIEFVDLRDFGHARRQRQIVGRILEQRIARDFHFVIVDVGLRFGQANGLRVGDEVHLVTALRQFQAEFGGDHAAAAVGGITGDSDLQRLVGHRCALRIGWQFEQADSSMHRC